MLLTMCEEREVQQHNPVWPLPVRSFVVCIAPFLKGDRKRDGADDEASWQGVPRPRVWPAD